MSETKQTVHLGVTFLLAVLAAGGGIHFGHDAHPELRGAVCGGCSCLAVMAAGFFDFCRREDKGKKP